MRQFTLPDLGEGLEEAEIVSWYVSEGDHVVTDQPLLSVETDKAVVEIPSPSNGRVAHLFGTKGDIVKVGAPLAKIGNTGPSLGPHLHFGLLNRPDMFTGRSLPFVIDSYTLAGTVDFKASQGDTLAVISNSKQVRSVYPLHGTVQNFP